MHAYVSYPLLRYVSPYQTLLCNKRLFFVVLHVFDYFFDGLPVYTVGCSAGFVMKWPKCVCDSVASMSSDVFGSVASISSSCAEAAILEDEGDGGDGDGTAVEMDANSKDDDVPFVGISGANMTWPAGMLRHPCLRYDHRRKSGPMTIKTGKHTKG